MNRQREGGRGQSLWGPGLGASTYISSQSTQGGGWGDLPRCPSLCSCPRHLTSERCSLPGPQVSVTTHTALGFSCPPIKGSAGLTLLGNSVQTLCLSQ